MTAPIDRLPWRPITKAPHDQSLEQIVRGSFGVRVAKWRPNGLCDSGYWATVPGRWALAMPTHWLDISDKEQPNAST